MATPAIENLIAKYPDANITLFGSSVATEAIGANPNIKEIIIDNSKKSAIRAFNIIKVAKSMGEFDLAISFRSHIYSKLLLYSSNSKKRFIYKKRKYKNPTHQVVRYNDFISSIIGEKRDPKDLKLYHKPHIYKRATLGINAGATYGSAKRWYPDRFAKSAEAFSKEYDIVIFGSNSERDIANEIYEMLKKSGVESVQNLAGKTTISQLCSMIGGLSLFITGDSGPMHIASAYKIPTLCIFGPTKYLETSQWKNPNSILLRKDLDCSPCMKRTCPIKTHECMKSITADEAIEAMKRLV